jgi:hypothetical protein
MRAVDHSGPPPSGDVAEFDCDVFPLQIVAFAQSLPKRGDIRCSRPGRAAAEEADHRHDLLLRAEASGRRHCAAQQ